MKRLNSIAMLTVYHHPNCGTCKKAIQWLDQSGAEYKLIDIREKTPPQKLLKLALKQGYSLKQLFNTSGQAYREQGIKDQLAGLSEAEAVKLVCSDGMLCKRPVVSDGDTVTIGFKADRFAAAWA